MTGQHPPVTPVERLALAMATDPYDGEVGNIDDKDEWWGTTRQFAEAAFAADPTLAEDLALGAAFREAVGALPEGWAILVGAEWEDGLSWWATASYRTPGESQMTIVSTSRGGYLESTPTAALQALTEKLRTEA